MNSLHGSSPASQTFLKMLFPQILILLLPTSYLCQNALASSTVDVGLILDLGSLVGKTSLTCMSMALEDFYSSHNRTTRIRLHVRDSKDDVVQAASSAIDLLKNVQVQAILGHSISAQADFVIDIGKKSRVPIISSATSPSLSPIENPYFIGAAQSGSSQVKAITALFKIFNWREVALIYEEGEYRRGIVPYLTDQLAQMCTCHPLSLLAFFLKAKEAGMTRKGYAWIITDVLTSFFDYLEPSVKDSMQGVIGVKPHVPNSPQLDNFTSRWRARFRQENPEITRFELNVFGLWAYDTVTALALAVERAGVSQSEFKKTEPARNSKIWQELEFQKMVQSCFNQSGTSA
ncbi:unnamed protein product [Thlaspi arvense]|uniref:Receptor ligand binding region domain-containing protein n=1 Tax=Thlaspi arvense TaxID=13288 RepID=A0AAU9RUC7_THLAR|nr:unnamed protein product [Thlaspi arvense]